MQYGNGQSLCLYKSRKCNGALMLHSVHDTVVPADAPRAASGLLPKEHNQARTSALNATAVDLGSLRSSADEGRG
eukprot:scaffold4094_cov20-Tisochrysis_lutea.AAC.2